jgi:hypothetical protein
MAGQHGGSRTGAGRPSNADRCEAPFGDLVAQFAGHLGKVYQNLENLADGSELVDEEWKAAGTITRKDLARNGDGSVVRDDKGKPTIVDVLVYPDKPKDEMVLVGRKVKHLPPCFKSNELMVDRTGGKARPAPEPDPEAMKLDEALDLADSDIELYVDPDEVLEEAEGGPDAG